MRIVARIDALAATGQAIEWRLGEEQVPALHQFRHFLKEEGHQQRGDMRAVHIGVGHDDDAFIPQRVGVAVLPRAAAQRLNEIGDFLIGEDLLRAGGRHVQYLAADGQYRLRLAVPRLLGAAARAVALDDEDFRARRVV